MGKTSIEWTDESWPVVNGCRRISPGCGGATGVGGCYAERLVSTRLRKTPKYGGLATFGEHGPRWTGESRLWGKDVDMPLRLKKPSMIFVADMGDLFYDEVSNEEIALIFCVMGAAKRHTFQVLTKRPRRMRDWFSWLDGRMEEVRLEVPNEPEVGLASEALIRAARKVSAPGHHGVPNFIPHKWPLPNVWLGVSVESQKYADERIPLLLQTPARLHFVSAEPLLERISLSRWLKPGSVCECDPTSKASERCGHGWFRCHLGLRRLGWVIVGGESGPGARHFDIDWARTLRDQVNAERKRGGLLADPLFFFKQAGSAPIDGHGVRIGDWREGDPEMTILRLKDRKGGDLFELSEDLRIREMPEVRA